MQASDAGARVGGEPARAQPRTHACAPVRMLPVADTAATAPCLPHIQVYTRMVLASELHLSISSDRQARG